MISQKTWESQAAANLGFFQIVDLEKLPPVLMEQMILEIFDQLNRRLESNGYQLTLQHCFTLNGEKVSSITAVH
jgi:hypothetical protein